LARDFVPSFYPCMMGPLKVASQACRIPRSTAVVTIACSVAVIAAKSDERSGLLAWLPFRMRRTDREQRCTRSKCTRRLYRRRRPCREQHSDVGPGPFIDWIRYSLWGRPCAMSQRSRGMLPRIRRSATSVPVTSTTATRDAMRDGASGDAGGLGGLESGLVRSSSVLHPRSWEHHVRAAIIS
jgi:hypothetical protein